MELDKSDISRLNYDYPVWEKNMNQDQEPKINMIVEQDDYLLYSAYEPDGETTYHLQINNVTLHFFNEEWLETLDFLSEVVKHSVQS